MIPLKLINKKDNEIDDQVCKIARTLAGNPKIIFANELTGHLDSQNSHDILKIFQKLNQSNVTIIMVTHDSLIVYIHQDCSI